MKKGTLRQLFIDELRDVDHAEKQSVELFNRLVELSSYSALQTALKFYNEEMKHHITRLEAIFALLDTPSKGDICLAMKGMIEEANLLLSDRIKSHVTDVAVISIAQKIIHYKLASYGVLRSFADHLDFDAAVVEFLQQTIYDEIAAEKKLNKIAEGTFFSNGVNAEAAEEAEVIES